MTTFVEGSDRKPGKLKRFLAFGGSDAYPGGGWNDFIGSADTMEDAAAAAEAADFEWRHVVDSETGLEVA